MAADAAWLVTGAAGRLGYSLCTALAARGADVTGVRHGRPVGLPGVTEVGTNLADPDDIRRAVSESGCRYIVHTAGLTDVDRCETHPDEARRIHVDATRHVAAATRDCGARLIYISTDHLWDGTKALVDEETPPQPINVYARTKYDGELAALEECPDALVLRTNFFGRGRPWRPSFSDWIANTLCSDGEVRLFTDVYFSPIALDLLCPVIVEMAERGASGVFHAAGGERVSKYAFGRMYAELFGFPADSIVPISIADVPLKAPRPRDMSLSTAKIGTFLGRAMPDCRTSIDVLRRTAISDGRPAVAPARPVATIGYGRQNVDEDDIAAVVAVLRSEFLTQGPAVAAFEEKLAETAGARFAVSVSSGTAALHIACLAAGMKPGDSGVTTALTFVASANAIRYCGGDVALTDIDPYSMGMDPASLAARLAERPESRVVIPVSFGGLAYAMADIRAAAGDRIVIEDASHSLGGAYEDGSPVGSGAHADMTVFSFHPVKSITAGEGGAVTTNDPALYERLKIYRNHGLERRNEHFAFGADSLEGNLAKPWYYEQQVLGYNYRLSDIHAALGRSQLRKIAGFIERRREMAARYDAAFAGMEHVTRRQSRESDRKRSAHHLYVIEVDFAAVGVGRAEVFARLQADGIRPQVHYIPVYRHPYFRDRYGFRPEAFPQAEACYAGSMTLPLHPGLDDGKIDYVVDRVAAALQS